MTTVQSEVGSPLPLRAEGSCRNSAATEATTSEAGPVLGFLLCYSVSSSIEIPCNEFRTWAKRCGIPASLLPKPVRARNAFQRATNALMKESQQARQNRPASEARESILLRHVPASPRERHIVKEVQTGTGSTMVQVLGSVLLSNEDSEVVSKSKASSDLDRLAIDAMVSKIGEYMDHCVSHYGNRDVLGTVSRYLRSAMAIPVRESGCVFFAPASQRDKVTALARFLRYFRCETWVVPLSRSASGATFSLRPEDLASKLGEAVDEACREMLRLIEQKGQRETGLPRKTIADLEGKVARLKQMIDHYSAAVPVALGDVLTNVLDVERKIAEAGRAGGQSVAASVGESVG